MRIPTCAYQEATAVLQHVWDSTFVRNLSSMFFFCDRGHLLGLLVKEFLHQLLKPSNESLKLMKSQIRLIKLELALQTSHLLSYSMNSYDKLCNQDMRLEAQRK